MQFLINSRQYQVDIPSDMPMRFLLKIGLAGVGGWTLGLRLPSFAHAGFA